MYVNCEILNIYYINMIYISKHNEAKCINTLNKRFSLVEIFFISTKDITYKVRLLHWIGFD